MVERKAGWHVAYLDALRGIAVLGVVMVHTGVGLQLTPFWFHLTFTGQRGVQLFYLVSAFTLTLSGRKRGHAEVSPVRNFFIRRLFRIAPMYYVAILLTRLLTPEASGTHTDLLLGLLFVHGFSPHAITHVAPGVWSIAAEATFYACLPFLLRSIRSLKSALCSLLIAAPAVALLSAVASHYVHFKGDSEYFFFLWFPIEFPVFLLGIALYFLWEERIAGKFDPAGTRAVRWSLLFLLAFAVIYVLDIPLTNSDLFLTSLGYACLVLALALHPWRLLVNRVTVFLGKLSFSIYLLHFWFLRVALHVLRLHGGNHMPQPVLIALCFFATLLPTVGVASLTWRYIEETGIRYGRRWIAHLDHRAAGRNAALPVPAAELYRTTGSARDEQF